MDRTPFILKRLDLTKEAELKPLYAIQDSFTGLKFEMLHTHTHIHRDKSVELKEC